MYQNILPQLVAQMARVAALCQACGKPSDIYAPDEVTPLCAKCWWQLYGEER